MVRRISVVWPLGFFRGFGVQGMVSVLGGSVGGTQTLGPSSYFPLRQARDEALTP